MPTSCLLSCKAKRVPLPGQGRGGWTDPRHLDTAWISVTLRDVNDNPPAFPRPHAHVTVREDATTGTLLATLPARDPDMVSKARERSGEPCNTLISFDPGDSRVRLRPLSCIFIAFFCERLIGSRTQLTCSI